MPIPGGGFYIADAGNNRVLEVDSAGNVTRVAGTGTAGSAGDGGQATVAQLASPTDAVPTADGGILIASSGVLAGGAQDKRIRKVAADGTISTVAGGAATVCAGALDSAGNGCPATQAILSDPTAAVPTADGGFLIAEWGDSDVRKVDASGIITKVAGGVTNPSQVCVGHTDGLGDGCPATQAILQGPTAAIPFAISGAAVTTSGTGFLVTEEQGCRVRLVNASGVITTVAGLTDPAANNSHTCRQSGDAAVPASGVAAGAGATLKLSLPTDARPTVTAGVFLLADGYGCTVYRVDTNANTYTTLDNDSACNAQAGSGFGLTAAVPDVTGGFLAANSNSGLIDRATAGGSTSVVAGGGNSTTSVPTGLPGAGGTSSSTTSSTTSSTISSTTAPPSTMTTSSTTTSVVTPPSHVPAAVCAFVTKSGVVPLSTRKKRGSKLTPQPRNTLAVAIRCNQAATVKITTTITAAKNAKHGLKKSKSFRASATVSAKVNTVTRGAAPRPRRRARAPQAPSRRVGGAHADRDQRQRRQHRVSVAQDALDTEVDTHSASRS